MRVERFEIQDWEEPQTGLLLAENEEWVLVKHIPVDFVVDGYKLYKKQFILSRSNGAEEQLIARVLKLKNETTGDLIATSDDYKDDLNNFNFGLGLGAGYYFTPNVGLTARYVAGFTDIYKDGQNAGDAVKNNVFQVGLAYKF